MYAKRISGEKFYCLLFGKIFKYFQTNENEQALVQN